MQPHRILLSMAAQVITPTLSGVVMDVNPAMLFAYITGMGVLMGLSVAGAKHGDAILIDEVVRREKAARPSRAGAGALAAGGRGSGQRT